MSLLPPSKRFWPAHNTAAGGVSFGNAETLVMTQAACPVLQALLIVTAGEMGKRETAIKGKSG